MSRRLLLLGGGGHCRSILDSVLSAGIYTDIGIIGMKEEVGNIIYGVKVIGCDDNLPELFSLGYKDAFICVGSVGNPSLRVKLFARLKEIGFNIPKIIDPSAVVSKNAKIGNGVFVGKNAVVNIGVNIGDCAIINTSAVIEHDCFLEDFVHAAPGSVLCGDVHVGANTHIGAGSIVKQQVIIGEDTIIGMGSVVLRDIAGNTIAYGNPCKEVKIR
ncbi:MAG: acetyltransferase [Saccharofermentanales bacterium]